MSLITLIFGRRGRGSWSSWRGGRGCPGRPVIVVISELTGGRW